MSFEGLTMTGSQRSLVTRRTEAYFEIYLPNDGDFIEAVTPMRSRIGFSPKLRDCEEPNYLQEQVSLGIPRLSSNPGLSGQDHCDLAILLRKTQEDFPSNMRPLRWLFTNKA